jgi:hypothetical protein
MAISGIWYLAMSYCLIHWKNISRLPLIFLG